MIKAIFIFTDGGVWANFITQNHLTDPQFFDGLQDFKASQFKKYLDTNPTIPCVLVLDTASQKFSIDSLGSLKIWDQLLLMRNRKKTALRDQDFAGYKRIMPNYYLGARVKTTPALKEWFDDFKEQKRPLYKILSMPVALADLPKKVLQTPWTVVIYGDAKKGCRHSIILHGQFYFARFFNIDRPVGVFQELENTLEFIHKQTGINPENINILDFTLPENTGKLMADLGLIGSGDFSPYHVLGSFFVFCDSSYLTLENTQLSAQLVRTWIHQATTFISTGLLVLSIVFICQGLIIKHVLNEQQETLKLETQKFLTAYASLKNKISAYDSLVAQQPQIEKKVEFVERLRQHPI
ncbi:MAG: hypothetical protein WCG05_02355 [Alphaproteobacteria bacterium]